MTNFLNVKVVCFFFNFKLFINVLQFNPSIVVVSKFPLIFFLILTIFDLILQKQKKQTNNNSNIKPFKIITFLFDLILLATKLYEPMVNLFR